jgi:hypothetical protein
MQRANSSDAAPQFSHRVRHRECDTECDAAVYPAPCFLSLSLAFSIGGSSLYRIRGSKESVDREARTLLAVLVREGSRARTWE